MIEQPTPDEVEPDEVEPVPEEALHEFLKGVAAEEGLDALDPDKEDE